MAPPHPHIPADIPDDPVKYEEAIRAFRRRVPVTDREFAQLEEDERAQAFKVAGVAQADLVNEVWRAVDRAVAEGTDFEEFKTAVGDKLASAWGGDAPWRLETVFRTNVATAYGEGRQAIIEHPEVKKARPLWLFDGVDDDRQSDICEPLDGTIRPADDEWWDTRRPPLHFNCRSQIVPLTRDEAEDEGGVTSKPPDERAQEGFGRAIDYDPAEAAPEYPPAIRDILEKRTGLAATAPLRAAVPPTPDLDAWASPAPPARGWADGW